MDCREGVYSRLGGGLVPSGGVQGGQIVELTARADGFFSGGQAAQSVRDDVLLARLIAQVELVLGKVL